MAEDKAPKTRQQRLTEQFLFRGKVYGPGEGKKAALVEVPADFPDDDELKARAEKSRLRGMGGPSSPLSVSARSAKDAMLEQGEDVSGDEDDEEEADEQPVAVSSTGEPLYAEDSEGDGSLDESMSGSDENTPAKKRSRRAAKKAGKKR